MPHTIRGGREVKRTRRPEPQPRRCLSCSLWFSSAGAGERLCELCKSSEDWADAVAACHGYIAW
jgi:hypothetical protein